jgi:hypothetical protein
MISNNPTIFVGLAGSLSQFKPILEKPYKIITQAFFQGQYKTLFIVYLLKVEFISC